jgi:hypothetical protein
MVAVGLGVEKSRVLPRGRVAFGSGGFQSGPSEYQIFLLMTLTVGVTLLT